jgi:KaiC/GvpD/RAD55 family RecA-like ATPase
MITGARAIAKASRAAPLPEVPALRPLYAGGVHLRAGQFVCIYGQPKSGKSTFVQWLANEMNVPTLYFSADMDAQDAITRLGAMRTGMRVEDVSDALQTGGEDYIADEIYESRITWCFDSGPTLMDIQDVLDAYVEVHDAYPRVIIIDNAMNIEGESEDEQGGLRFVFKELHRLAHETGICVIALHHAREEGDPTQPPSRSQMQGKVAQLPEIILGVALDQNVFKIAPVAVRSGKCDPSGKTFVSLSADPERAMFAPYQERIPTVQYGGQGW